MEYKNFKLTESAQRESEDLSSMIFQNIDFKKNKQKISFFRSDFRKSKFINTHFYFNNFDRADFVSCMFEKSKFERCNIAASEIKNCFFLEVEFSGNQYNNTSIQECIFENCVFPNEQFLVNMKSCKFINCEILDCSFERSTTELLDFRNCKLINTNLATMHAECHQFTNCILDNVEIGLSYFFGYLFSNTSMENIEFLYRGRSVDLEDGATLSTYLEKLAHEGRYFELINGHIQFAEYNKLLNSLDIILEKINHLNSFERMLEVKNLFRAIQFYIIHNMLPYSVFIKWIEIMDCDFWENFPFEEKIEYLSEIQKVNFIINELNFNEYIINSAEKNIALLTFNCKTDSYNHAYETVNNFLTYTFDFLHVDYDFELVKKEKGSWLLTFAMTASAALIMVNVIKSVLTIPVHIQKNKEEILLSKTRIQIAKTVQIKVTEESNSYKNLKNANDLVKYSPTNFSIEENDDTNAIKDLVNVVKMKV